jgi:hypothetical protein
LQQSVKAVSALGRAFASANCRLQGGDVTASLTFP